MKAGLLFLIIGLLYFLIGADVRKVFLQENSGDNEKLQTVGESLIEEKDLDVRVLSVDKSTDSWTVEVEIVNKSEDSLFLLTNPRTSSGKYMAYVSSSDKENSTLNLSVQFFKGPKYFLYVNATRVKLTELKPNTSYSEKYYLPLPLRRTLPPYGDKPSESAKLIDTSKIKNIQFSIGVLPSDKGIQDLLIPKKSNPFFDGYFTGGETIEKGIFKGKKLLDIQAIFNSSYKVSNN